MSTKSVRRAIKDGRLRACQVTKQRWRVTEAQLAAFLEGDAS